MNTPTEEIINRINPDNPLVGAGFLLRDNPICALCRMPMDFEECYPRTKVWVPGTKAGGRYLCRTQFCSTEVLTHLIHTSDCAIHNAPAFPPGPCDCGATPNAEVSHAAGRKPENV